MFKRKKNRQLKWIKGLIAIFCLIGFVYTAQSFLVDTNAPVKAAKKTELAPGKVGISKIAEPVAGMVNQWDITLRIEGRNQFPPPATDIVLIVDTSGSMKDNDRMIKAKTAAEKFVNMVLRKDYENRIALVTYSSEVTNYTFNEAGWSGQFVDPAHKGLLIDKIKELEPVVNGGTYTQAGIKSATEVMAKATGKKRNIVLISDGVPTYSYPPTAPYNQLAGMEKFDYLQNGYDYYETVKTIPKENFDYSKRYGNGARYRIGAFAPEYEQPQDSKNRLMANHAHSAIAEATISKNEKRADGELVVTDFYTIGVDMDSTSQDDEVVTGNQTMKEMATSEDKSFAATADNLEDILSGIAGEIVGAIKTASVVDSMGDGFEMDGGITATQGITEIKEVAGRQTIYWEVGTLKTPVSSDPDEDVMFAEIKYRVNAGNDVLKPDVIGEDGLAATNKEATIKYKDYSDTIRDGTFDVPFVKPIIVSLQKKLLNEKGEEINDRTEMFDFKYGNDSYTTKDRFSLYSNDIKKIVHPWKADQDYFVEELLKANQDYETTIDINGLETKDSKATFKFALATKDHAHQQIIVTNKQNPKTKTVLLNIRQSVLKPNSELVVPSKGFYHSTIDETQQSINLISESTTKDTAPEVSQTLFTKYEITLNKGQKLLKITDLVPEYYTFFGYIATKTNENLNTIHLSSNTAALIKNNQAVLDYQTDNEYWVTMFITPNFGEDSNGESPRPYSWDYKVNKFG